MILDENIESCKELSKESIWWLWQMMQSWMCPFSSSFFSCSFTSISLKEWIIPIPSTTLVNKTGCFHGFDMYFCSKIWEKPLYIERFETFFLKNSIKQIISFWKVVCLLSFSSWKSCGFLKVFFNKNNIFLYFIFFILGYQNH